MSKLGSNTLKWVSNNAILQKYPRLQLISQCYSRKQLGPMIAYTIVSGLFQNPFVSSRVLYSSTLFDQPDRKWIYMVYTQMNNANVFSHNTMIKYDKSFALSIYFGMLRVGTQPDKHTFPFLCKSLTCGLDNNVGKLVHAHAIMFGFGADNFVRTTLISLYCSCGDICDALDLFDGTYNKDVTTWTAVISGLVSQSFYAQALHVFNDMRSHPKISNVSPNVATMVSTVSACAGFGSLELNKNLHAYVKKSGLEYDIFVRNSLIDSYAKCGSIFCALQMFHSTNNKDIYTWTSVITGLASHGRGNEALDIFSCMQNSQTIPDDTSFIAILMACCHSGLVNEGITIFETMGYFNLKPNHKHYGCIVDLLSRAGLLRHAYKLVSDMPMEPNLAILGSLLSACRVHGDIELAKLVLEKIEKACNYHGGAHVLLSNLYADQNQWHDIVSTREESRRINNKPQGHSWI